MKNQDEIDDLVLKYIHGELDSIERGKFETELKSNQGLMEAYRLYTKMDGYLNDHDAERIKGKLKQAHERFMRDKPKMKRFTWIYKAAALVIILISAGVVYWLATDRPSVSPEELYSTYYNPYSTTIDYRSDASLLSDTFQEALETYESQEYDTALILFKKIISTEKPETSALFFAGICSMELDDYRNAIIFLNEQIYQNNLLFTQQASWYLALSYLKTNQKTEAKKILEHIVNEYKYKHREAVELLDEL